MPINKKKQIELKASDQNKKIQEIQNKKKQIVKDKKEKILNDIEQKKKRFEWKQQKVSIQIISKSWIVLYAMIGSVKLFDYHLHRRMV